MISKYLHLVSSTKSQITIFILLNICGLIFFLLPHNIFSNMIDLELFYSKENVIENFSTMGPDGRSIYVLSSLLLDTVYPILYLSLFLGAFFPFADGLLVTISYGAKAVIQPGGSMKDDEVITAANEAGISMVFTGKRHFRH